MAPLEATPGSTTNFVEATALPFRHWTTIAPGPVLVVAPHPDDETLGCGGAIAQLRQAGYPVLVLVVSDGAASHPRSQQYPPPRLRQMRAAETLAALDSLGVAPSQVTFLGLPDGAVPADGAAALAQCQRYIAHVAPRTVFLPYQNDPHRDHRATWRLLQTAIAVLPQPPRRLEYPIWALDPTKGQSLAAGYQAWRLDIRPYLDLKRQAIACYRSQTTDLIPDDPTGFRLSPDLLATFLTPWEVYLEAFPHDRSVPCR